MEPQQDNLKPAVLHAAPEFLVVDKPAGLLSIPDGYDHGVPYLGRMLEPEYGRLWIVHRLDKETSGVMVVARTAAAHRALNDQFAAGQVSKTYRALIVGVPAWEQEMLNAPLRANVGRRNRTTVDLERGKTAQTLFRTKRRFDSHALVTAHPATGRTHQIRAHLYFLGFSIVSDPLYGDGKISPLINRLALHARSISFWCPATGEMLTFEAGYPLDFKLALDQLD